jgi:hypothetical protein
LSSTLAAKITGSCGTTAIIARSAAGSIAPSSTPSMRIAPRLGS